MTQTSDAVPSNRRDTILLALIVLAYLVIGALYAIKTPAWQVPDEPAHYNYVAQVETKGCCPVLESGDWDNDYLNTIKAAHFSPESIAGRLNTIQYEDHQPPLYYLLAAPVYSMSGGSLSALRLFSVVIGAGIVIVGWVIVRVVFPGQPWLALGTAAFVAFLPQHVAMMAGVENDCLTELIVGLILLGCARYVKTDSAPDTQSQPVRRVHPSLLGIMLGAAFLTKLTAYPMVFVIGLAVLLRTRREKWTFVQVVRQSAWVLVPALILGSLWWIRNLATYGGFDVMGQARHDQVVVGQQQTSEYIAQPGMGIGGWLNSGAQTTFDSFWGQFGWMGVPMPEVFYTILLAFSGVVITGACIAFFRWRRALSAPQIDSLLLLDMTALLAFIAFAYYNLKFVQFQGRYLYPGLIPIGLFVAIGLAGWVSLIARRFPWLQWGTVAVVCLFAALDIYALFKFIIPQLA